MDFRDGTSALTMADARRFLSYFRMAVLGILAVLAVAVELLVPKTPSSLGAPILYVFYAIAALDALAAWMMRRRLAGPAEEILHSNPQDSAALMNWLKGQIVALPMALGLGFLGVMARVLGAAPLSLVPFYLLALVVLFSSAGRN